MIVTLTTDFGTRDGYVAAMKGVMLGVEPDLTLIDVTHDVPAQDVMAAAFVMQRVVPYIPAGAVHLAVVDPGVGTDRRAVAARFDVDGTSHLFVGPDNGLLPLLAPPDHVSDVVTLDRPEVWASPTPAPTFHGRDLFGPVAAALAAGATLDDVGSPTSDLTTMHWPLPRADEEGINGMVLHIDRFGNCLTNITSADLAHHGQGRPVKCYVGSTIVRTFATTYAEVPSGETVLLFGSSDQLEIAIRDGDAAQLLSVERGAPVTLVFEPTRTPARSSESVNL